MCISKILSQEQHLYHVILNKSVYSGNMLQVFIITEAIVLLIWKVFWTCLFPPMLWNLNRAVATGISPVSIVERVHSYSTKRINLRDVKHSWYFRHLKMGNFKLLHTSCIVHSWHCWHLYPCCSFPKNEAGWWLTYALVWKPWWPKAPSVSYQPASPFDTGSEDALTQQQLHVLTTACQFPARTQTLHLSKEGVWGSGTEFVSKSFLAWVLICCPSISSFLWVLPGQCLSCRQRCTQMKCRAAGSLHLHSWF